MSAPFFKRRRALLLAATAAAGTVLARPAPRGAKHDGYFSQVAQALHGAGLGHPVMLVDKARLIANQQRILQDIASQKRPMDLRLVAKSLPSLALLDHLMAGMRTRRLMLFNLQYLQLLARERPDTDILLGKPLPVAAAARFYREHNTPAFIAQRQLQWLIDSSARLAQYRDLARAQNLHLRINLEIDVGLHRGGFADAQQLQDALEILRSEPRLQYSGMMGYDAHLAKIPDLLGNRAAALEHAKQQYATFAAQAANMLPASRSGRLCMNTAGSPTYRLHDGSGIANELAIGSGLLKPSDFDTPLLEPLEAAAFIATPVLKAGSTFHMPYGVEALGTIARWWDVNSQQAYFIYGGNWLADPVSPPGLAASALYGNSSNQQILLGSGRQNLRQDDWVILRPRQSEAVLQQFGPLALFENGKISDFWEVFPAQA